MAIDYLLLSIVAICGWSLVREGLWGASLIFMDCLFAGLLAMNFFEPLAGLIENIGFLKSYADLISLCLLFAVFVTIFREIEIRLCPELVRFPNSVHRAGGVVFGLATGWLLAGFILCAVQTVPFYPSLGLGYSIERKSMFGAGVDRQWLAFVHRTSKHTFESDPALVFDEDASYIDRYHVVRNIGDGIEANRGPEGAETGGGGGTVEF
jgi:colicin V production protein